MSEHVGGPRFLRSSEVLRGEGTSFDVWGRKMGHAEERLKVLIDDFYIVREDIVLGPFPTHLGWTRLGFTRLGSTRITCHPILHSWLIAKHDVNRAVLTGAHGSRRKRTNG